MRLGKVYELIEENRQNLALNYQQTSTGQFQINNFYIIREGLKKIAYIKALEKSANALLGVIPHTKSSEKVIWSQNNFQTFNNDYTQFLSKIDLLFVTLSESIVKPEPGMIYGSTFLIVGSIVS